MLALKLTVASAGRILLLSAYAPPGPIQVPTGDELTSFSLFIDGEVGTTATLNNRFIDSSPNNLTVTATFATEQISQSAFSPFGTHGWCGRFASGASYLEFGHAVSSRYPHFDFMHNSTATFTFECWFYRETDTESRLIENTMNLNTNTGTRIGIYATSANTTSNKLFMQVVGTTSTLAVDVRSSSEIALNTWTHVAVTYDRSIITGTAKIYINGILDGVADRGAGNANNVSARYPLAVGGSGNISSNGYTGTIADLRISNAVLYNSNFTLPTSPVTASSATTKLLILQHQNSRIMDNSINNFTCTQVAASFAGAIVPGSPYKFTMYSSSTGGSAYIDGQALIVSSSTSLVIGESDFTIDCWVYMRLTRTGSGVSFDPAIVSGLHSGVNRNFYISGVSGSLGFGTSTTRTFETPNQIPIYQWTHVAVERSGGTMRLYVNGKTEATTSTNLPNLTQQNNLVIGVGRDLSTGNLRAHISDLRIINGQALFNGDFTPPTSMSTATSGTSLLLNFTNGAWIDKTGKSTLSVYAAAGAVTGINSSVYKNGNASLRFANGNFAFIRQGLTTIDLKKSDFTIEFWINFVTYLTGSASSNRKYLVCYNRNGGATITNNPLLIQTETNKIGLYATSDGSSWNIANNLTVFSGTPTTSVWHHLAVTRNGNTIRTFANGTLVSSTSTSLALVRVTTPVLTFGSAECYIDDFRIYKGYAKYIDSFTPE